jgi:hypothetical protein
MTKKTLKYIALAGLVIAAFFVIMRIRSPFALFDGRPERLEVMQLRDIAYDVRWDRFYDGKDDFTVYIKENGVWEPFLVLTAHYPGEGNGETLLLRRYLIAEPRPWRLPETPGTRRMYYATSDIDHWLNTEYIKSFAPSMQERILMTNIETWDGNQRPFPDQNISRSNRVQSQVISRQIFLLSLTELGGQVYNFDPIEGEVLDFFNRTFIRRSVGGLLTPTELWELHRARYMATQRGVEAVWGELGVTRWWLRSRRTSTFDNSIAVVMDTFYAIPELAPDNIRVRPAFCLPGDTPIHLIELDGRLVYVIHD